MSEINSLEDLMMSMSEVVEPVQKKFYVHIDKQTLKIVGVSPHFEQDDNTIDLEIEEELAVKFLIGEENLAGWIVFHEDNRYDILKKSSYDRFVNNRVDVLSFVQVEPQIVEEPDITIVADTINNEVIITYNGLSVRQFKQPIHFYFTKEDDPTYLQKSFILSEQVLSHMAYELELDGWPQEIKLAVEDADDLSVFSIKSQLQLSLSKI